MKLSLQFSMASSHLLLLLLLPALLLTSSVYSISAAVQCPNCGTTPVPYPLSTAPTCGDQMYKVQCHEGQLIFDTLNNSYPIISIDPLNQRLVIQPADILPNTCVSADFVHQGIQLNRSLPFNVTSSNTVMLFNCSDTILDQPLDCAKTSLCHVYLDSNRGKEESQCENASLCCAFKAGGSASAYAIRVREKGCRAYKTFVNLNSNLPIDSWPAPAVELQWVLPQEPLCGTQKDCDGDSNCQPDPNMDLVKRCYCLTGLFWDPVRGVCAPADECKNPEGCDKSKRGAVVVGVTTSLSAISIAFIIGVLFFIRYKRIKDVQRRLARDREEILSVDGSKAAKLFSGKEIKKATNNFSKDCLVGAGGYGEVYKGTLEDGTMVAIKCAQLGNTKGTNQILNEVRILCQVNHRSLVRLLGCCVELVQPILVYEYVQNGTLLDHLQGLKNGLKMKPCWMDRLRIAGDAAECLSYLHTSATPPIYHRDIKSSNILLDENLNVKVSDFGLSRLACSDLSHISTCAQGTIGYLDPEYFRKFQLTDKSDVYSFGVVLLELLTSLKVIDFNRKEDDVNLTIYAQRMLKEEKLMEVIDPLMVEKASLLELDSMKAIGLLALDCLDERRESRPSMKEVADEIEYILSIVAARKDQFHCIT